MDPQQVLNYYFVWSMILNPYLAQFLDKKDIKIKPYVTTVIRCTWYVCDLGSFIKAQIFLIQFLYV